MKKEQCEGARFRRAQPAAADTLAERLTARYRRVFSRAAAIARSQALERIFDELGFQRSLGGYKTLLYAVRLYCSADPRSLSDTSFKQIIEACAEEFDGAPRWIEKQMRLVILKAYKTGSILNFDKYAVANPVDLRYPMTAAEFAAELRSRFILEAMKEETEF